MDGNRRYARERDMHAWKGHEAGGEKLKEFLEWCKDLGIKEATFYTFSVQNFKRSKKEKQKLFHLMKKELSNLMEDDKFLKNDHDVQVRFVGRTNMFPEELQEKMKEVEQHTEDNKEYNLNFAVGYGGREELIDAIRKVGKKIENEKLKAEEVSQEEISEELYLDSEPDMIIRTGDVVRTSNFLMWQGIYSEWFFLEKMWPAIEKEDLKRCIEEFKKRERRFGE